MNSFMQFTETSMKESKLSELAKENQGKTLDYKELDKPIKLSSNNSGEVSFKGSFDEDNYNYYMKEANNHKFWAESHERSAKSDSEMASSYSDDPSKVSSYIHSAEDWQSKADSEWKAYREDLEKASSYK